MYERPVITKVGKVAEVVLGIASLGIDIDGALIIKDFEFRDDSDEDDEEEL
jgi:hypothetical protein